MNAFERERLRDDHRRLDEEIARRLRRPWTDPTELQQLKKQKLAIKDRLHRSVSLDRSAA
ncbi:MAG: YdcH family protein [Alphaproteobacteria bacterium]